MQLVFQTAVQLCQSFPASNHSSSFQTPIPSASVSLPHLVLSNDLVTVPSVTMQMPTGLKTEKKDLWYPLETSPCKQHRRRCYRLQEPLSTSLTCRDVCRVTAPTLSSRTGERTPGRQGPGSPAGHCTLSPQQSAGTVRCSVNRLARKQAAT